MGAIAGGGEHRHALRRYGHNLGMAFQIADDLLDYTGTEAVTGKPTGHDLRERKVTLPLVGALQQATPADSAAIRSFFTRVDPTDDEIAAIVAIVVECGGLEYAQLAAARYAEVARGALAELPGGAAVDALMDAISYAVDRRR
jgi:octaprenyl-diphosphate synthase